ncbi:Mitochondrial arginine transporter BAC2 [Heracleum sosnowskyi]|uniref:Mitochondrial arginine transporter BAC2 n=1 Tax=Heracleum sosnowskyi TaxID=360622 RepID=A0AAD8M2I0_9APIA|nr:Mitochondrial arginine transporter BAC2 [Heracleum sosnowskyi]
MDFWPEFLANSWGKEFVAGGFGGVAGVVSGYPLDTVRIRQQQSGGGSRSAFSIFRNVVAKDGVYALYKGMGAPLASVTIQNALVFQTYALLSRACDSSVHPTDPPSYKGVFLGAFGTGAIQSLILSPVELVKIRLQLQGIVPNKAEQAQNFNGPTSVVKGIYRTEGLRGIYRGLTVTVLRDAPSYAFYFFTYEYVREQLHPGCRKSGQETCKTMLMAGGLAGVASWTCCYPLDVVKTRLQSQSPSSPLKYNGIVDCLQKSVRQEGYRVLFRGLGTAVSRAFVVNGAVFTAYETSLRLIFNGNKHETVLSDHTI